MWITQAWICPCRYETCGWQVKQCDLIRHGLCLGALETNSSWTPTDIKMYLVQTWLREMHGMKGKWLYSNLTLWTSWNVDYCSSFLNIDNKSVNLWQTTRWPWINQLIQHCVTNTNIDWFPAPHTDHRAGINWRKTNKHEPFNIMNPRCADMTSHASLMLRW